MAEKRFRQGDTREDGKIFWQYVNRKNGKYEWWVSQEKFEELKRRRHAWQRREAKEHPERITERGRRARAKFREANPARKKLTPEEFAERRRESARRYYRANREKVLARKKRARDGEPRE